MATNKIAIDVEVKSEGGAKSLKDLKQELKELQKQISDTKEGSEEYYETLKKIGATKDEIEDLNETIAATTGAGKFQAIANMGAQIANGFQLAQGAMALFGTESEGVTKALQKAQAAMAFAQGIKELEGLADTFKNFKMVALDAFKAIKGAIGSTGIGLLVTAVGAAVGYFMTMEDEVSDVTDRQEELLALEKESLEVTQKKLDAISQEENILKLQGATETDILKKKKQATEEGTNALKEQIRLEKERLIQFEKDTKDAYNYEFAMSHVRQKAEKEINEEREKSKKKIDEINAKIKESANLGAGFQLQLNKINEDEAQKDKAEAERIRQKNIENYKKAKELREKQAKEDEERRLQKIKDDQAAAEGEEALLQQIIDADNEAQAIKDANRKAEIEAEEEKNAAIIQASLTRYEEEKRLEEEKEARQKLRSQMAVELTQQTLQLTADIVNNFAKQDEASQRKAFEINKKVQLALATIDMIKGVQSAFTSAQASPFTAVFPGYPYVQAAMAAAYGIMNIRKISQTQFQGGGGAESGMSGAASGAGGAMSAPLQGGVNNTSTMLENLGQGQQEQKPIKAYVLQTDVASEDQKIKAIENKSKIE